MKYALLAIFGTPFHTSPPPQKIPRPDETQHKTQAVRKSGPSLQTYHTYPVVCLLPSGSPYRPLLTQPPGQKPAIPKEIKDIPKLLPFSQKQHQDKNYLQKTYLKQEKGKKSLKSLYYHPVKDLANLMYCTQINIHINKVSI